MIGTDYAKTITDNIQKSCCLDINQQVLNIILNMVIRIISIYLDASSKITKHCDRETILLKDINLVQEFIENQYIILTSEVNSSLHQKIDENYGDKPYTSQVLIGGGKKDLNKYISSKKFKEICEEMLKKFTIDTRASNKILEKINDFLNSFIKQCQKHCATKKEKSKNLEEKDVIYLMSQE